MEMYFHIVATPQMRFPPDTDARRISVFAYLPVYK
jgi:hypothetical protein